MKIPILAKLVVAVVLPLLVVSVVLLLVNYNEGRRSALRHTEEHLSELTAHHAALLDGELETVAQVARSTASLLTRFPDLSEEELYRVLEANVQENTDVFGSAAAFERRQYRLDVERYAPFVYSAPEGTQRINIGTEGYDYFARDWFLLPRELERAVWTDPYFDEGAGEIVMCTYSVPFSHQGALRGVTTVDISLEELRRKVAGIRIEGGYAFVVGQNGTFVSHPDASLVMRETVFSVAEWYAMPELAELGREMISGRRGIRRIADFQTGEPKWVIFSPLASNGWSLAAVVPEAQVMAPVLAEAGRQSGIMLAGLALVVVVILITSVGLTRPIRRIAGAVRDLAGGNLEARVEGVRSRDEIGEFARAFNKMVGDLREHVERLTEETAARRAVESELNVARGIQAALMPKTFPPFPEHGEFDLHGLNIPAKYVAGDFFDFFFVGDDVLTALIADVSGKGVPAALFMAVARTVVRNVAAREAGPGELLGRVNDILAEDNPESRMFVTLFLFRYNIRTGELRYANAGHEPPLLVNRGGEVRRLGDPTGPLCGIFRGMSYGEESVALEPGQGIALFTDGVTEAQAADEEEFGRERLAALLARLAPRSAREICEAVAREVDDFQLGERYDDTTFMFLRRNK